MNQPERTDGRDLIIVGAGETAKIAHEYFRFDSPHTVHAFSAEEEYIDSETVQGLPVVPFSELAEKYPPSEYAAFVAVSSTKLNRVRQDLYERTKENGYSLVSYVSSDAFVWRTAEIGENAFILENNVVQHDCTIGDNVVLWSGNHVGHRSRIGDHSFITSHAVISGFCDVGEFSFIGVNACIADETSIGNDCIVGAGGVVHRDLKEGKVYVGNPVAPLEKSSYESMGMERPEE
ncbi:acetyltransferase [Halorussus caseinilyticus]|uniref:acetyltransferase n=1 Tax=Halorussus caseinilyticus TaxID=3034025 RepID=UPI0023E87322|nr:acetyltransferase [Halorussus sp. DT72]